MIIVNCPFCGVQHKVSDDGLGKLYRCNQCNSTFSPSPPANPPSKKKTGVPSLKKKEPDGPVAPRRRMGGLTRAGAVAVSLLAYTGAAVGVTVLVFKQRQIDRERSLEAKETELLRKENEIEVTAKAMEKYQVLLNDVKSREQRLRAEQEKWVKGEHEKMKEWRQREQNEMQAEQRRQQKQMSMWEAEKATHNDEIKLLKTQLADLQTAHKKEGEERLAEQAAHRAKIDELKSQREALLAEQKREALRKKTEEELFAEERAKKREDRAFHRELKKDAGEPLNPTANEFYRKLVFKAHAARENAKRIATRKAYEDALEIHEKLLLYVESRADTDNNRARIKEFKARIEKMTEERNLLKQ